MTKGWRVTAVAKFVAYDYNDGHGIHEVVVKFRESSQSIFFKHKA